MVFSCLTIWNELSFTQEVEDGDGKIRYQIGILVFFADDITNGFLLWKFWDKRD